MKILNYPNTLYLSKQYLVSISRSSGCAILIFGPNCFFVPYDDIEEAIKIANCTQYGLAASVFTRSSDIYQSCLRDIDAGLINLNSSTVGATARLPFGGLKNSGNHHPAAVSMIDHCVGTVASLETLDDTSSKLSDVVGLKD